LLRKQKAVDGFPTLSVSMVKDLSIHDHLSYKLVAIMLPSQAKSTIAKPGFDYPNQSWRLNVREVDAANPAWFVVVKFVAQILY
jgi:hypothetical protein